MWPRRLRMERAWLKHVVCEGGVVAKMLTTPPLEKAGVACEKPEAGKSWQDARGRYQDGHNRKGGSSPL